MRRCSAMPALADQQFDPACRFGRCSRRRLFADGMTSLCGAALVIAHIILGLPASAAAQQPTTKIPELVGCSTSQSAYLRDNWRLAHNYVWRAERLIAAIRAAPAAQRAEMWEREHDRSSASASPRTWFGPYSSNNLVIVAEALSKARQRFEGTGTLKIRRLRCGMPTIIPSGRNVDVCPAHNPGGDGPPSAFHSPAGVIVTCGSFWNTANNMFVDLSTRQTNAARTLVHEIFHWMQVNSCPSCNVRQMRWITDYHGDGVGGLPDRKYYGTEDAQFLAENNAGWARRTPDNYAFFARNVGNSTTGYYGAFVGKGAASGTGGMFMELAWPALRDRWRDMRATQTLIDIETDVLGGSRVWSAVWEPGRGDGALWIDLSWQEMVDKWNELLPTQHLIDVETYVEGGQRRYAAVWRPGAEGGAFFSGMTWSELLQRNRELSDRQHLIDVETYIVRGQRLYIGVWKQGALGGELVRGLRWRDLSDRVEALRPTHELIDFEPYWEDGARRYVAVFRQRTAGNAEFTGRREQAAFAEHWRELWPSRKLIDLEMDIPLPRQVR
jgi:hypothetical protein